MRNVRGEWNLWFWAFSRAWILPLVGLWPFRGMTSLYGILLHVCCGFVCVSFLLNSDRRRRLLLIVAIFLDDTHAFALLRVLLCVVCVWGGVSHVNVGAHSGWLCVSWLTWDAVILTCVCRAYARWKVNRKGSLKKGFQKSVWQHLYCNSAASLPYTLSEDVHTEWKQNPILTCHVRFGPDLMNG